MVYRKNFFQETLANEGNFMVDLYRVMTEEKPPDLSHPLA